MKKKHLELWVCSQDYKIEELEHKVLELQEANKQLYQRIENICQLIALSDLNPAVKYSKLNNND